MAVLEYDGRLLIIDCGVLFPDENQPGVDLILPDFDADPGPARRHRGGGPDPRPRGPHRRRAVPAARAPRHPAGRLEADARAARGQAARAPASRRPPSTRSPRATGSRSVRSTCEFVAVNHSIPDALAVAIRTPAGHAAAHRRLQDGPAAARRPDHRPARVRAARRGGRRPLPRRLDQRRGARLHHRRAGHRAGARPGLPHQQAADHRGLLRLARAPRPAGDGRRRRRTAARSRTSAARWCATWGSPATSATSTCRRARSSTPGARRPAAGRGRDHLDRVAGRAAVGAVPDRAPQPRPRPRSSRATPSCSRRA